MSEIQQRLGELAERIIYRRDQSVGQEKRDLLAADANLIAETQARLDRAEGILKRIAQREQVIPEARSYFASMRGATPEGKDDS